MGIVSKEEYFEDRITKLVDSLNQKTKKFERNRIEMVELGNKIKEFETAYDEGFEMFSPIVATDASFNTQEIKNLKMKIYLLIEDNNALELQINEIKDELNILRNLYDPKKASEKNNSPVQSDSMVKQDDLIKRQPLLISGLSADEIADSIKRIIDYCDIDIFRAKIELNNLLNKIEETKS